MNKIYRKECFYWRSSRSFTKRDKYAYIAICHNYSLDYRIFFKNFKKKRMAVYKVKIL